MNADTLFKDAIVFIATVAAILRFAFVEYEGVLAAWRRMVAAYKRRTASQTEIGS
jgi:hypothetical protein